MIDFGTWLRSYVYRIFISMSRRNTEYYEALVCELSQGEVRRISDLRDRLKPNSDLESFIGYLVTWAVSYGFYPGRSNNSLSHQGDGTYRTRYVIHVDRKIRNDLSLLSSRNGIRVSQLTADAVSSALWLHENSRVSIDPTVPWPNS